MRLVCITGIDGTGKTTLARNTAKALKRNGIPATYMYGRTYPVLSRALMFLGRMTLLRKRDVWNDYTGYTTQKKATMRNPLLASLYTGAILLDYYVQVWAKLLPHLLTGRTVLSDRYIYDTVISDLTVHLGYTKQQTEQAISTGLRFLPKPTVTVLIDVPPEVAFSRKDDVPHVDYLRERRDWYLLLESRPEVVKLNGGQSPERLVESLLKLLQRSGLGDRDWGLEGSKQKAEGSNTQYEVRSCQSPTPTP